VKNFFRKHVNGRSAAKVAAVVLLVIALIGGTFAWNDFHQHRTNIALGRGALHNATLNDVFVPPLDWRTGENSEVEKLVFVNYPDDGDYEWNRVYVRLKFWEFFAFQPMQHEWSEHRYITWPFPEPGMGFNTGEHISTPALETEDNNSNPARAIGELRHALGALGFTAACVDPDDGILEFRIEEDFNRGNQRFWYVRSVFGIVIDDDLHTVNHGQLGKHVATPRDPDLPPFPWHEIDPDTSRPGSTVAPNQFPYGWQVDNRNIPFEYNDPIHDLQAGANGDFAGYIEKQQPWQLALWGTHVDDRMPASDIRKYVSITLGDDIILLSELIADDTLLDDYPTGVWIVDDIEEEGWVFWSIALQPGAKTSDFVEALDLISQPNGRFVYSLHVGMQAVSDGKLGLWVGDTNEFIMELLGWTPVVDPPCCLECCVCVCECEECECPVEECDCEDCNVGKGGCSCECPDDNECGAPCPTCENCEECGPCGEFDLCPLCLAFDNLDIVVWFVNQEIPQAGFPGGFIPWLNFHAPTRAGAAAHADFVDDNVRLTITEVEALIENIRVAAATRSVVVPSDIGEIDDQRPNGRR
jgi:hypothetical protein